MNRCVISVAIRRAAGAGGAVSIGQDALAPALTYIRCYATGSRGQLPSSMERTHGTLLATAVATFVEIVRVCCSTYVATFVITYIIDFFYELD